VVGGLVLCVPAGELLGSLFGGLALLRGGPGPDLDEGTLGALYGVGGLVRRRDANGVLLGAVGLGGGHVAQVGNLGLRLVPLGHIGGCSLGCVRGGHFELGRALLGCRCRGGIGGAAVVDLSEVGLVGDGTVRVLGPLVGMVRGEPLLGGHGAARDLGKGFVRRIADAHQRRVIDSYTAATFLNVKVD